MAECVVDKPIVKEQFIGYPGIIKFYSAGILMGKREFKNTQQRKFFMAELNGYINKYKYKQPYFIISLNTENDNQNI